MVLLELSRIINYIILLIYIYITQYKGAGNKTIRADIRISGSGQTQTDFEEDLENVEEYTPTVDGDLLLQLGLAERRVQRLISKLRTEKSKRIYLLQCP